MNRVANDQLFEIIQAIHKDVVEMKTDMAEINAIVKSIVDGFK